MDVSSAKGKNRMMPHATSPLAKVTSVAAGVQFTWALQLSLLTPYVQELGISHTFASYVWLCGPISGLLIQPLVGICSDNTTGSWGRRKPFIMAGASLVVFAGLLICFSSDIGHILGDISQTKTRSITIFILGFWILDAANNALQVPCRALLADFAGKDPQKTRQGNTYFAFFLGAGSVLGFAAGSFDNWPMFFPFTQTYACDLPCANLKSVFLLDIVLLIFTVFLSVTAVDEIPWVKNKQKPLYPRVSPYTRLLSGSSDRLTESSAIRQEADTNSDNKIVVPASIIWKLFGIFRELPKRIWVLLLLNSLSWLALSSFLLFDTDWMGREVYGGAPNTGNPEQEKLYRRGVGMGAFGLMFNSIVMGISSLVIEPLCKSTHTSYVWASANVLMAACFASTAVISLASKHAASYGQADPPTSIKVAALAIFASLGVPLAVTSSLPYALMATSASSWGGGQGLFMGVMNFAVVIPQMLISIGSGPWDSLFGGGNMPSFIFASAIAFIGGILAAFQLSKSSDEQEFLEASLVLTHNHPIP